MITTGMLRRRAWLANNEFDYIVKNSQRILKLNYQYKNHPYVEEFTKQCSVMFIYGTYEADVKFSLINRMRAWNYLQKTSDLPLNAEVIKQIHKIMMDGEYRKSAVFTGYHIFPPASHIEGYMQDVIFKFHETKKDGPFMVATNLFGSIMNIHPFEDGNERIFRLILAHVLIQMKCCPFPALLSSFHKCGRRHYIQVVKRCHENPSMPYTMIVGSLMQRWYNFEQNARMLGWSDADASII